MENYASHRHDTLLPGERAEHLYAVAHEVGSLLLRNDIPFRVWSGAQAAAIGNHRESQDVDMWVPDWAIRPAYECLSRFAGHIVAMNEAFDRTIVTVGEDEVELMANMDIYTRDGVFPLRLTSQTLYHKTSQFESGWTLPFAPPEDTLLLKAILQRDASIGKHDGEDIAAMLASLPAINQKYLANRMNITGSAGRAAPFLRAYGMELDMPETRAVSV